MPDASARDATVGDDLAGAAQAIERALEEIARDLAANDVVAAARAVGRLTAACRGAAGCRLDEPTLARLQPLIDGCAAQAATGYAALSASMAKLAAGNRARRAYRDE
jgi:hypothetical protein